MTNNDYLQRFRNIVYVATAYNVQFHEHTIVDIVTETNIHGTAYKTLTYANKVLIQTSPQKLCMATMFISQAERCQYGKMNEELENYFTKVDDD